MARSTGSIHIADNSVPAINDAIQQLLFMIDELRGEHNSTTIKIGPHTHTSSNPDDQDGGPIDVPAGTIDHDDLINVTTDQHHAKLHETLHREGGADELKLDDTGNPDDNTDNNTSLTAHGLCPKLSGDSTQFLNGAGGFTVPGAAAGAGGSEDLDARTTEEPWEFIIAGHHVLMTEQANGGAVRLDGVPTPNLSCVEWDDMVCGAAASTNLGRLRWGFTGGTVSALATEANHPGIIRSSHTAASAFFLHQTLNTSPLHTDDYFDITFVVRPNSVTSTSLRFGPFVNQASTSNPPTDGIYFEFLAASDTFWTAVTRSGSSQQKQALTTAPGAGTWARLRMRRISPTQIGFTVDDGPEVINTGNIPSGAANIIAQQVPTVGTQTLDFDFFSMVIGLKR